MKSDLKNLRDRICYYVKYHLVDKNIINASKIHFHNWWSTDIEGQWLYQFILNRKIPLNNTIHFFSVFGNKNFLKYYPVQGKKIFYTGEDVYDNAFGSYKEYSDYCLNDVDLSLGFDERGNKNYLRFPVWIFYLVKPTWDYQDLKDYIDHINRPEFRINTNRTGFVSHISRHDSSGIRKYLIDLLNEIGNVECAGSFLNNTDRLAINYNDNKIEYLKNFKFNLCPENTSVNQYITEKCIESICAGCIPIYWGGGNNAIEPDILNQRAILRYTGDNEEKLLNIIREIDSSSDAYIEFSHQRPFKDNAAKIIWGKVQELEEHLIKLAR